MSSCADLQNFGILMGSFKTDKLSTNGPHLHEDLSYNLQSSAESSSTETLRYSDRVKT